MSAPEAKIIVLTGPTASGKTALAVKLAAKFNCEIVSADSRQCYRKMDIGSGKDLREYGDIPFHLIDVEDPGNEYNLARFTRDARRAVAAIIGRGRVPLVCGGSVLYCDALISGYELPGGAPDPEFRAELNRTTTEELAERLRQSGVGGEFRDWGNRNRMRRALEIALSGRGGDADVPKYDSLVLGMFFPREELHRRIAARLDERLASGMIDEVRKLHDEEHVGWERLESFGLEYRRVAEYLQHRTDFETMRELLFADIRRFAKRQDIWFRKLERKGIDIHWLEKDPLGEASELVGRFLAGMSLPAPGRRMIDTLYGRRSQ